MFRVLRMAVLSLVLGAVLLGLWQLRSREPRGSERPVAALQPLVGNTAAPPMAASAQTESPAVAAGEESAVPADPPPVRCWRIGPLDEIALRAAKTRFAAPEFTAAVAQEVQRDKVADWIYLPPRPTLAAAREEERRLRDLGVQDLAVVTSGMMRNGLSLGVYAEAGGALRRMAELRSLGVEARIEPRFRERQRAYLRVRAVDAPRFDGVAVVRTAECPP